MMTTDNHLVPPNGFGYVNAGICRGAYPVKYGQTYYVYIVR